MPGTGLWRTKSIEQSISDTDEPETKLRRNLSAWDLTVFGVAVVIGAGIFTLTARTAGDFAGPSVSVAFVIAAIACALAALCYAEFASTVPVAGSAYTFSYATFGEFMAWIIGWDLILELAVGAAAVAKGWSSYLQTVLEYIFGKGTKTSIDLGGGFGIDWGAFIVVAALVTLLVLGTKLSSRFSMVITGIKVAVVLFVVILGFFYIKSSNYTPFVPEGKPAGSGSSGVDQSLFSLIAGGGSSSFGIFGLLAGASIVFFAFIGFDIVATTAEETRNPQKAVPRGIFGSLAIVTVLYVAVSLVVVGMVPYTDLSTSAGDGSHKTLATAFSANGVDWAANIISVGTLFAFILVSAGVLVLRKTRPDLTRAFRVPGVWVIAPLAILACLWLMLNLTVLTWLRFVVWMVIGVVIYFAYSRRHSLLGKRQSGVEQGGAVSESAPPVAD